MPAPFPPIIYMRPIPQNERAAVGEFVSMLIDLGKYQNEFEAALRLIDMCDAELERAGADRARSRPMTIEQQREAEEARGYEAVKAEETSYQAKTQQLIAWSRIAARDGAMTMFHYGKCTALINRSVPKALQTMSSAQKRKIGAKLFASLFPDFDDMRHSVAHAAEFYNDPAERLKHVVEGAAIKSDALNIGNPSAGVILAGTMEGRRFQSTMDGRVVAYELTEKTLGSLNSVTQYYYSAFEEFQHPAKLGR